MATDISQATIMATFAKKEEKEAKKQLLKDAYTPQKRFMDVANGIAFAIVFPIALAKIIYEFYLNPSVSYVAIAVGAFFGACYAADFFSGLVHWGADTWGSFDTPFVGNTFIRSFREHHLAPTAMCQHDVFETNGDNCMLTLPVLIWMILRPVTSNYEFFVVTFWSCVCLWVAVTNQIHAWSHDSKAPGWVRALQKTTLILPPETHRIHHQMPFDRNYCITNGWCDTPLGWINFWRNVEFVIEKVTGIKPRYDDQKWTGLVDEKPAVIEQIMKKQ